MPAIGYVTASENGTFKGQLKTLSIRAEITLAPNARKANDVQPDYRVYSGDVEIGAGWNRIGERAGAYIALQFDDPQFAEPVRANLIQVSAHHPEHILLWTRPSRR